MELTTAAPIPKRMPSRRLLITVNAVRYA